MNVEIFHLKNCIGWTFSKCPRVSATWSWISCSSCLQWVHWSPIFPPELCFIINSENITDHPPFKFILLTSTIYCLHFDFFQILQNKNIRTSLWFISVTFAFLVNNIQLKKNCSCWFRSVCWDCLWPSYLWLTCRYLS